MPMHEYEDEQNKDKANDKAALDKLHQRMERHDMEVDLITKYSPFTTEEDLLGEFESGMANEFRASNFYSRNKYEIFS